MAANSQAQSQDGGDDSLYPIAILIDELRNEDVQVIFSTILFLNLRRLYFFNQSEILISYI